VGHRLGVLRFGRRVGRLEDSSDRDGPGFSGSPAGTSLRSSLGGWMSGVPGGTISSRRGSGQVVGTVPIVDARVLRGANRNVASLVPGWSGEWVPGGRRKRDTVDLCCSKPSRDRGGRPFHGEPGHRFARPWAGEGWGTGWRSLVSVGSRGHCFSFVRGEPDGARASARMDPSLAETDDRPTRKGQC